MKAEKPDKLTSLLSFLDNHFKKEGSYVGETEINVQVNGIYSLPEEYARMNDATPEYLTQLKVFDYVFPEAKYNIRQMTEEELKKIEEDKKAKKPPPKGKVEEPSAEEKERMEKERLEKEEKLRKQQEEWNSLPEIIRFQRTKEDPTKEPWINLPVKNTATLSRKDEGLIELEDDINVNKGFFIEFYKIPNPDEDPKKKKAPPKNVNPDDLKPMYTIGWVNLSEFLLPGHTEITQRVPIMLKETFEKSINQIEHMEKSFTSHKEGGAEAKEEHPIQDIFQQAKTYIYIKISITPAITPSLPKEGLPLPNEILKKEEKVFKQSTLEEICADFNKQLKIAIEAVAKQYINFLGDNVKSQLNKKEKINISNVKKEERDKNITQFLYSFNNSGKAELLKEKLKRFIIRIVREKYPEYKDIKGIFKDERDQIYSKLFAYLSDEVKQAMDEYVQLKRDELHEDVISSFEQSKKEALKYSSRVTKETEEKRLLRLSVEYDIMDNLEKSYAYYKNRLQLNNTRESWFDFIKFSKKNENLTDCEDAIVNCINFDFEDLNLKILFSCVKYLRGRYDDAINFMLNFVSNFKNKGTNPAFNIILALFFKEKNNELMFKKHMEAAKRLRLLELGMISNSANKKVNSFRNRFEKKPTLSEEKQDEMFYELFDFFNSFNFFEITAKLLDFIYNKTGTRYQMHETKVAMFKKDYQRVINVTNEIIINNKTLAEAYVLSGNAYFYLNNFYDSEEAYIKAVRYRPEELDIYMLYRLGLTYIKRKSWEDAKVVFLQLVQKQSFGFAWRYLGLAYTRLGEYEYAERALSEANLLDIDNPEVWGYLTLFCLQTNRRAQALECLNELKKVKYSDTEILTEIANIFYKNYGDYFLASQLYSIVLKYDRSNVDVAIDLSFIYSNKIFMNQESIDVLTKCLKEVTLEKDKEKLQARINKITDHHSESEHDQTQHVDKLQFEEGLNEKVDRIHEDHPNFFDYENHEANYISQGDAEH